MNPIDLSSFKFTILLGLRIRSGTNYLGKVMSCNPHVQLVPPATTQEFPLMTDLHLWDTAFAAFAGRYGGDKTLCQIERFRPHLGSAWLTHLIDTFGLKPGHVFLKDPSVKNIDRFFDVFPDARLIILIRDGRDNVASSMKAGLAARARQTMAKRTRQRLNHWLRRDFVLAARDWSTAVKRVTSFDAEFKESRYASQYLIVRYEDVFRDPRHMAERIFSFMGVPYNQGILDAVANAEVVGSSFYSSARREDAHKPNWKPTPRTDAFQPVGRWKQWSALQKSLFKRIAGKQLVSAGYESDLSW
jgi:hypothetical protein